MAGQSSRSASLTKPTAAASDTLTKLLDAVEAQWPGSTRIARLIARHDEWLRKKRTNGRSCYHIITEALDDNWRDDDDAEFTMTLSEYSRLTDGFDPIGMTPLEIRTAMVENGYAPIPVRGKAPILNDWPAIVATKEVVEQCGNVGPGTGLITTMTPVLDIDILDEQAADIVEATARLYLEDKGQILVRIGLPPKRAIPLRTNKPFSGIQRHLLAPDGTPHLIEVRASRQQVVVAGIHDDTKKPYVWKGGRSPIDVPRDQLPPADDIQTILDLCVGELKTKLGWTETGAPAAK